jgi:hypothetical protein
MYFYLYVFLLFIIVCFFTILLEKRIVENFHEYKYTAVIIEPREHAALEFVLQNFNDNLSEEWQFVVFHGNKNIDYTQSICDKVFIPERVKLVNLGVDNLTISQYSEFFYSELLYSNIPTEVFLIFQTDSIICSQFKENINQFLQYDYVGAPWDKEEVSITGNNSKVGNGGLSLRRKSKMKEVIEKCQTIKHGDDYINEDIVFSNGCGVVPLNKPTEEEAKLFSLEQVYHDQSFGIHKAYAYLDTDKIAGWCPEINTLKQLNVP